MQCTNVTIPAGTGNEHALTLHVYSPDRRLPPFVPVVVAVHDLGMCGAEFAPLMPRLAEDDAANTEARFKAMMASARPPQWCSPNAPPRFIEPMFLVTFDHRHHGGASAPGAPEEPLSMAALTADCVRVLEYVQENLFRHHQIFVLSHGVGAAVAACAVPRVNKDTTAAIRGLVFLRDWLSDGPRFSELSQLASRPPSPPSVRSAVSWYVQQGILRSAPGVTAAITPLLEKTVDGTTMRWTTAGIPVDALVTESTEALKAVAPSLSLPCLLVASCRDQQPASSPLATLLPSCQVIGLDADPTVYYPSIDLANSVVRVLRSFVNEVNRDTSQTENRPAHTIMMVPRPGPA